MKAAPSRARLRRIFRTRTHLERHTELVELSRLKSPGGGGNHRPAKQGGASRHLLACPADPPDDARLRNLHERTVVPAVPRRRARLRLAPEHRARIALAEVAHRAVIDQVERVIGPE